jgi:hypothetical protein
MRRVASALLLVGLVLAASGAASAGADDLPACSPRDLAFALPATSAPHQSQALGFAASNVGATACRLELPLVLTLRPRFREPLRVSPAASRLRLVAPRLGPRARATVSWTYTNYCGRYDSWREPILYTVAVAGIELRGRSGAAPCHASGAPVSLGVLFACPGARGPAIEAILPRPLPLCPR